MWNIKALALTVQKLLARLKFQRGGQNDRQDKNNMPPDLRSRGHKNSATLPHHIPSGMQKTVLLDFDEEKPREGRQGNF